MQLTAIESCLTAGRSAQDANDLPRAGDFYEQAGRFCDAAIERQPWDVNLQHALATVLNAQGALLSLTHQYEEAGAKYHQAEHILEKVVESHPQPRFQNTLAALSSNMAQVVSIGGRQEEAEANLKRAMQLSKALSDDHLDRPDYLATLAATTNNLGKFYEKAGTYDRALMAFRDAAKHWETLHAKHPTNPRYRTEVAVAWGNIASVCELDEQYDQAVAAFDEQLKVLERLARQFPEMAMLQKRLASAYSNTALFYSSHHSQRDVSAAEKHFRAAIQIVTQLVDTHDDVVEYKDSLANTQNNFAVLLAATGRREQAVESLESSIKLREQLVANRSENPDFQLALGESYFNRGLFPAPGETPGQVLSWYDRAIDKFEAVLAEYPGHQHARLNLQNTRRIFAEKLEALGKTDEAQSQRMGADELD